MKNVYSKQLIPIILILLLSGGLLLNGCTNNLTPTDPQSPSPSSPSNPSTPSSPPNPSNASNLSNPPAQQLNQITDFTVTYNYGDTGAVQLSANNLMLKVGQTLSLEPAPGLYKGTRFASSGDNLFSNVMKQDVNQPDSGKAVFIAITPGKGRLQIIPNGNETARAVDLWVTVQ